MFIIWDIKKEIDQRQIQRKIKRKFMNNESKKKNWKERKSE